MKWKRFVSRFVARRGDRFLFAMALLLIVSGALIGIYDVVTIVRGTVDANRHIPFLPTFELVAIGGITLVILRHTVVCPRHLGEHIDAARRESFLDPAHHPLGRRDAPDGLSD